MESAKIAKNSPFCHDCGREIKEENGEIKNGFLLTYEKEGKKIQVFKCKECFEKNPALTSFQECEVYSRVVGYLRPVTQWNEGKRREFKERLEYTT